MKVVPKIGHVYYLKDFTAPKVFCGDFFECVLTDQRIKKNTKIIEDTNTHISKWPHEIYSPKRFKKLMKRMILQWH